MVFSGILAQAATQPEHTSTYYYLLSLLYGVVEGITEFLPISSTAHLRIVEGLCGTSLEAGYWKMYSVVIQLGAILSVPLLYWTDIMKYVRTFPRGENGRKTVLTHPITLVLLAFVTTAVPAYLLDKKIGNNLENLWVIGGALLIGGVVMWVVDALCRRPSIMHVEEMGPLNALWIGGVQILSAVFPGTSRSMSTIAAGQVVGMSRSAALDFSFLVSIPTMLAATGFKLLQAVLKRPKTAEEIAAFGAPPSQWMVLAIGFLVSFLVAWAVNAWFIRWVKKHGFMPFAVYRIVLGLGILIWAFAGK